METHSSDTKGLESRDGVYSLEPVLHDNDPLAHGLHKVVVAGDLRSDNRELMPLVAFEDAEHGGRLVVQRGGQLQL